MENKITKKSLIDFAKKNREESLLNEKLRHGRNLNRIKDLFQFWESISVVKKESIEAGDKAIINGIDCMCVSLNINFAMEDITLSIVPMSINTDIGKGMGMGIEYKF